MSISRYFVNSYGEHEHTGEDDHDIDVEEVTGLVLSFARHSLGVSPTYELEGGVYVGGAGVVYMLIHMSRNRKLQYPSSEWVISYPLAQRLLETQIVYYRNAPPRPDFSGFLVGKAGVDAIAAVFYNLMSRPESSEAHLKEFASAASVFKTSDYHGSDELLVGRSGYLCACLWLQEVLGKCPVSSEDMKAIWLGLVESGRRYSVTNKSLCPLMYAYYGTEYLGAVHGLSLILQIILSFPTFCTEFPEHDKAVHETLDYFLTLQDSSGNFPPEMDDVRNGAQSPEYDLVHFCHGAPGVIYMLGKAYLHYKEVKYLEAAVNCGRVIWHKGLLRKGPGLCHGVSGNGYAFLLLYRLTNDPSYLYKAKKFKDFLNDDSFRKESRIPDCPQSLFEGTAGLVCFLTDLLSPAQASFPFFNIFYNYKTEIRFT